MHYFYHTTWGIKILYKKKSQVLPTAHKILNTQFSSFGLHDQTSRLFCGSPWCYKYSFSPQGSLKKSIRFYLILLKFGKEHSQSRKHKGPSWFPIAFLYHLGIVFKTDIMWQVVEYAQNTKQKTSSFTCSFSVSSFNMTNNSKVHFQYFLEQYCLL